MRDGCPAIDRESICRRGRIGKRPSKGPSIAVLLSRYLDGRGIGQRCGPIVYATFDQDHEEGTNRRRVETPVSHFLEQQGLPIEAANITREGIESLIARRSHAVT